MNKNSLGIKKMNYKFLLSAGFLGILLVSGCASTETYDYEAVPQQQPVSTVKQTCPAGQYPTPGITGCAAEDEFINYTKVAADYREYGERTPRDRMIVQSGAGSNMAATIPPTIDGEVVEYEEEVSIETDTGDNSAAVSDSGDGYNADDPVEDWLAEEGKSLKTLLTEWCDRSGWRLVWNTNRNYKLTAGAMFRGRFADVSSALIRAFARARPAPIATFYKGNRVLVVETMEDENAYE